MQSSKFLWQRNHRAGLFVLFSLVDSIPLLPHSLVMFNVRRIQVLKKKKKSLQWCCLHFYSWILSPNFYSLSSIWGFIKHHKLELSFTGKQDDLISMGLPLLHQVTFPLWVSWSPQLWLWLSSQPGDRRSPVQLTLYILGLLGFFLFFSKGKEWEKFFNQVFSSNFTS